MNYKDLADSPIYRTAAYSRIFPEWVYLDAIFEGVCAWSEMKNGGMTPAANAPAYLPKYPEESATEYVLRFQQTEYPDSYKRVCSEYVDLLFANDLAIDAGGIFAKHWDSISIDGIEGAIFSRQLALDTFKTGTNHVFVDWVGDRPRWVPIAPTMVPNWEYKVGADGVYLSHVTIIAGDDNGKTATRYEHGGSWRRWSYEFNEKTSEWDFEEVGTGVLMANGASLTDIPLVTFHLTPSGDRLIGQRTFRYLADKTRALYQVTSDYRRKMRLCNTPVPVIYDPTRRGDLVLSPYEVIQIGHPDGYFKWSETSTDSLEQSRIEMDSLTLAIATESSKFLSNPTPRISSEAVDLSVVPLQANLFGFSRLFTDGLSRAIAFHLRYLGIDDQPIEIDLVPSVRDQKNKDSQFAFGLNTLFTSNAISRTSLIKMLADANFLDDETLKYELSLGEKLDD